MSDDPEDAQHAATGGAISEEELLSKPQRHSTTANNARATMHLRLGAAVALLLVAATVLLSTLANDFHDFSFPTFALHPLLMSLAFGVFAPLAAIFWRLAAAASPGTSRSTMKAIHVLLMVAATLTGIVGVADMWRVHDIGAAASLKKGIAVHFQSLHSWIGIVVMMMFAWQAVSGLLAFGTRVLAPYKRKAALPPHRFVGSMAVHGGLVALVTGLLSMAGRGNNENRSDLGYKFAALLIMALSVCLAGVLRPIEAERSP